MRNEVQNSYGEDPFDVFSILSCNLFETPATAETTTLILSFSALSFIIVAESIIRRAFPIDVPPNFNVIITSPRTFSKT